MSRPYQNPLQVQNTQLKERIAELEANNKTLREAAWRVVFEAEADQWSCMPSIEGCKNLAKALGEGE